MNTPRLITDAAGTVVWRWDNEDPFGNNAPNENPNGVGNFTCNLRLPGQYFDRETNLHYNYFRDFDPSIGRYVQSDPIGLRGGINTFGYARSSPIFAIDPFGLWSTEAHNKIIQTAFPGLSGAQIADIQKGSALADSPSYQTDEYSYMHALASSVVSPADCSRLMCDFFGKHYADYERNKNSHIPGLRRAAYRSLGMAIHPIMDSTSPVHGCNVIWKLADLHLHGDMPNSKEGLSALTPALLDKTVRRIKDAMSGRSCGIC